MVLSLLQVASRVEEASQATLFTSFSWPSSVEMHSNADSGFFFFLTQSDADNVVKTTMVGGAAIAGGVDNNVRGRG
jgi:hypothetical protein